MSKISTNPKWAVADIDVLYNFCAIHNIRVSDTKNLGNRSDEAGIFFKDIYGKAILVNVDKGEAPATYISVILHELGHLLDLALDHKIFFGAKNVFVIEYVDTLLTEYLAGIYGYVLHSKLNLKMPRRFYTITNKSNIRLYKQDIESKCAELEYNTVLSMLKEVLPIALREVELMLDIVLPCSLVGV